MDVAVLIHRETATKTRKKRKGTKSYEGTFSVATR